MDLLQRLFHFAAWLHQEARRETFSWCNCFGGMEKLLALYFGFLFSSLGVYMMLKMFEGLMNYVVQYGTTDDNTINL